MLTTQSTNKTLKITQFAFSSVITEHIARTHVEDKSLLYHSLLVTSESDLHVPCSMYLHNFILAPVGSKFLKHISLKVT